MSASATQVTLPGGERAFLILRTDSVAFKCPAKESAPDPKGFKHRTRRATPDEEKKVLKQIAANLGPHFPPGNVPGQLREFMKGYELWYTDAWHKSAEIYSEHGVFLGLVEKQAGDDPKDDKFRRRSDYYLWGHPTKKPFRSSAEVLPHVIWLAFDTTGLGSNCTCLLCSLPLPASNNKIRTEDMLSNAWDVLVESGRRPEDGEEVPDPPECQFDLEPSNKFIFRTGEIGWFDQLGKGQEWRLGVVKDRFLEGGNKFYLFQPLSNPEIHIIERQINERDTKVFLAMTPPGVVNFSSPEPMFDAVNWLQKLGSNPIAIQGSVIDSSIMAAKQVDCSYTLLNKKHTKNLKSSQNRYSGIFLGAEKVWVGDAVRVIVEGDDRILFFVVREIVEGPLLADAADSGSPQAGPKVLHLTGDTFECVKLKSRNTEDDWIQERVPSRVIDDLIWSNNHEKEIYTTWRRILIDHTVRFKDIAGRWYPTETLWEYMQPSVKIQEQLRDGVVPNIVSPLNRRMQKSGRQCEKRESRKDALGGSVPDDFEYSDGVVESKNGEGEARKDKRANDDDGEDEPYKAKRAKNE